MTTLLFTKSYNIGSRRAGSSLGITGEACDIPEYVKALEDGRLFVSRLV